MSRIHCRFIDTGANNAFTNMAIDEALLQCCQIPTLRIYQWNPKAVSIGYNQDIIKEINIEACKELNIDIVRRITGGKAILHDNELTYSFIFPENINLVPKDVTESYKIIAKALVIALKQININAEIKKQKEKVATPICFNSSNWYELLVNNKKISGSAQRRFDGKILQHGSILIDFDYEINNLIFKADNKYNSIQNLKKRITSIKHHLNNSIKNIKCNSIKNNSIIDKKTYEIFLKNKKIKNEIFENDINDSIKDKSITKNNNKKSLKNNSILNEKNKDKIFEKKSLNNESTINKINNERLLKNKKNNISLKKMNNKNFNVKDLIDAIKYGFEKNFDFNIIDDKLNTKEINLAKKLFEEKYSNDEWNYRLLTTKS